MQVNYSRKNLRTLFTAVFLAASCQALAATTPETLDGASVVSAEKARELMERGAIMVDTRTAAEYAESHITGAIHVPYREKSKKSVDFDASVDRFDLSRLPVDKSAGVITQCNGAGCWKSYKAAAAAAKAGYQHVYWFRGGLPEWKEKNLPIE
jgi:rhodanese-related sulfurtransferase